jgi:golgi to ER traffic protein 4
VAHDLCRHLTFYFPLTHSEGAFEAAEPHLLAAGKRDSARVLADMFVQWSSTGGAPGAFALRGTIP